MDSMNSTAGSHSLEMALMHPSVSFPALADVAVPFRSCNRPAVLGYARAGDLAIDVTACMSSTGTAITTVLDGDGPSPSIV